MKCAAALLLLATQTVTAEYAGESGSRVYYETSGRGEPAVVLIHGWTCDSSFWRLQTPELAKRFRVLNVDLPGHGRSDKPDVSYTAKMFADGVRAAMDAAGIKRAVLIGHSMGTAVSLHLLNDTPERVAAIVSVDGVVRRTVPPALARQIQQMVTDMRGPDGMAARRKMIEGMFQPNTSPELREEILTKMLGTPPHVAASAMENLFEESTWTGLKPVGVPVLALNMRRADEGSRRAHDEVFTKLQFMEFDGVSHFLHMEQPAKINDAIIAFVSKLK